MSYNIQKITTLGQLKSAQYQSKSIKQELRDNLMQKLRKREKVFERVIGYEETVVPQIERAILSGHNINLLGLRGQAKTSIARAMVNLLDEYIPALAYTDLNDDPLNPISQQAKELIDLEGDDAPIRWIHRIERYTEKLATPDVTVADLIGDVDPIKAANLKLSYSDERVIHFGLIPNANRGIFVINELPDLQARIQVALFNILQEGDIQIRGFKVRLPLDIQFVFTANPEDYTNRGAIITPLKDRIEAQIITHYPKSIETSQAITRQEANINAAQRQRVLVNQLVEELVENVAFEARESEFIDQKSGVSARLSISAHEALIATAERRAILNNEAATYTRLGDMLGIIPAITGKVELVYEGEQEGAMNVAHHLLSKSIRKYFPRLFPDPELIKRKKMENVYAPIVQWFNRNELELLNDDGTNTYEAKLDQVNGLKKLVEKYHPKAGKTETYVLMEFVLSGLAEYSQLSKHILESGSSYKDLLNAVFSASGDEMDDYNN